MANIRTRGEVRLKLRDDLTSLSGWTVRQMGVVPVGTRNRFGGKQLQLPAGMVTKSEKMRIATHRKNSGLR